MKVGSPRDPMEDCGITADPVWRDVLTIMFDLEARLACMEEKVLLAEKEHNEFVTKFLLAICYMVFVVRCGAALAQRRTKTNAIVRRSLLVPRRFRERLWGPGEIYVDNLQDWYSVQVFPDPKRGKLHIKGDKDNVLEAYAAVRDLMKAWYS